ARGFQERNECVPGNRRSAPPEEAARLPAAIPCRPWLPSRESDWIPRNSPPLAEDTEHGLRERLKNHFATRNCRDWPFRLGFRWRRRKLRHGHRPRKGAT